MPTLVCKNCREEFKTYNAYKEIRKFCSRKCYDEWQHLHPNKTTFKAGHKVPQEWRDKNIEAHKGIPLTKEHKEKLRKASTGKKHKQGAKEKVRRARLKRKAELGFINSPKSIKKMSLAKIGKHLSLATEFKKGMKPWNFNNYSSLEPYGQIFNEKNKDKCRKFWLNYCQLCGIVQECLNRRLDIHHIDYIKQNNNFWNWIPLCPSCHAKTQLNRKYWIKFFQEKVAHLHNNS